MSNTPWSLTPVSGITTPFMLDNALGQAGQFTRGVLTDVRHIAKRQIIASVVAHQDGERRTNSRTTAKEITFTGHVWGNPNQDEAQLHLNLDVIEAAMRNGTQQLCILPDGRYWNAELLEFNPHIVGGDPWHAEYDATFYAADPFAYGATTSATVVSGLTMSGSGGLYTYSWTAGTAAQLGSMPSPLVVTVTLTTANGAFYVQVLNSSTSPATSTTIISSPFQNGDLLTFDSVSAQAMLTHSGAVTKSSLPVFPLLLDSKISDPTSLTLSIRATSAPIVTIAQTFVAKYL